jgi:hypothetical protein
MSQSSRTSVFGVCEVAIPQNWYLNRFENYVRIAFKENDLGKERETFSFHRKAKGFRLP